MYFIICRPNLVGKNKYEFARNYCDRHWPYPGQGNCKVPRYHFEFINVSVALVCHDYSPSCLLGMSDSLPCLSFRTIQGAQDF